MRAPPRPQRHKLKQTPRRLHLPYRPARRTPMSPCPSSTLPALSEQVTPIAGRAARGAIVELLRSGERHDRAVADQSGQFVMVPPRLPPGDYDLTLRSRQPDGQQATSKQGVVVTLTEAESSSGTVRSRAEVPFNVPDTVGANRSVLDQAVASSQAHQSSRPPLQIAKRQDITGSQLPHATAT